jgi:hypothetical protein
MRGGGHYAIFHRVAGGQAQDADGFDANVLVGRGVYDGGIGLVGNGAGEGVDRAAAGVGDAHEREFDLLERAVVVEGQPRELAGAEFVVDVHSGVYFLAAVAVRFKAHPRFEQFDLHWKVRRLLGCFGRFWRWLGC